jgi:hypothetical protein
VGDVLTTAIILGIAAAVLLVLLGVVDLRTYLFVIKLRDGRAVVSRGKVTSDFVDAVAEVCGEFGVKSGWVGAVRRGPRDARLEYSRSNPKACPQRLRNVWGIGR